jgi:hypothetical protein
MADRICTALGDSTHQINCRRFRGRWEGYIIVSYGDKIDDPNALDGWRYEGGFIMNVTGETLEGVWREMVERAELIRDMLIVINPLFPPQCTPHHADPVLCEAAGALSEVPGVIGGWRAYKAGEHGDTLPTVITHAADFVRADFDQKCAARKARLDAEREAIAAKQDAGGAS